MAQETTLVVVTRLVKDEKVGPEPEADFRGFALIDCILYWRVCGSRWSVLCMPENACSTLGARSSR